MNMTAAKNAAVATVGTLLLSSGGVMVSAGNTWQGLAVIVVGLIAYVAYELIP